MNIRQEYLDAIYETLADKLHNNKIVSEYLQKYPTETNFAYIGKVSSLNISYYLENENRLIKLTDLSDISCDREYLDRVLSKAEDLIQKAKEER